MRAGVSSSGRWWVSMGPVGWLIYAVCWLAGAILIIAARLVWALALGVAWLARAGWRAATTRGQDR
jgi:hypothetical protein